MLRILIGLFSLISAALMCKVILPRMIAMRNQSQAELEQSHARLLKTLDEFNKLYHLAPCGYLSIDKSGKIIAMNATELAWLDYAPEQVIDKLRFVDIISAESRLLFQEMLPTLISTGSVSEVEFEMVRRDGSRFPVLFNATAIKDGRGRYTMSRCTTFDISRRKKAEEALRENQELTRSILESANDAFISIDTDNRISDWNKQAEETFGWMREEAIGRTLSETIIPPHYRHAHEQGLKHFLVTGEGSLLRRRVEMSALHKDGHEFPVELAIFPVRAGNTLKICAFVHDIIQRKQAEETVKMARDQAIEASRFKSEFLANMSHEIRTPMNGILGMTEMLMRSDLNDRQSGFVTTIKEAGKSLLSVINDILDFSKIEAGKLIVEMAEFEPVRLVESVAELLADQAKKKQLSLLTFVDPQIPSLLVGDSVRLRQILMNFAGNAIKFSDTGQVVLRATLEAEEESTVRVNFSVTDTGIGMTEEEMAKLFQPFVQVDGSITRRYGGTGLGLSICKSLAELLNGELGVHSSRGKGSKFWFSVPLERAGSTTHIQLGADMKKMRVIVVDDDESSRDILHQYILSWGMRNGRAHNADEALQILRQEAKNDPYSVAIIDLYMTGTSGLQLGQIIREDSKLKKMKLILVTAYDNPGAGEEAIRLGFDAYLTKPIKQSQLLDCITNVVRESSTKYLLKTKTQAISGSHGILTVEKKREELILVVEDNTTNQEVALLLLNDLGFEAHIANNGRQALELMELSSYSLVFMDCQMPELDGFGATGAIRKAEALTGKHVPIVAMTAHALEGSREQCLAAGMDDYISKPVDPDQLHAMTEKWLPAQSGQSQTSVIESNTQQPYKPVDLDALARKYGEKNITRITQPFLRDAPIQCTNLRNNLTARSLKKMMSDAHGLKGICGTVCATRMREICIAIESAGKEKNWEKLSALTEELEGELEAVKKQLNEYPTKVTGAS